jgi:hypothetical protein
MKPMIKLQVVLQEAQLDQEDNLSWQTFQERAEHARICRVVEARLQVKWLKANYVPQPKREEPVTADNCHRLNRYGAVNKEAYSESNGDVVVSMDTIAHRQCWIFNSQGECVWAVTYVDFGVDTPATRSKSALEHKDERHTA